MFADNWEFVLLFQAMGTQWRVGAGGATGLDNVAVIETLKVYGKRSKRKLAEALSFMQVMERAALRAIHGLPASDEEEEPKDGH